MCWICDPVRETVKTVEHVFDVAQNDKVANTALTAAALAAGGYYGYQYLTAAEIGAGSGAAASAELVPLTAAAVSSTPVVPVIAGGAGAAASGGGFLSTAGAVLDTSAKVVGGLNALSIFSGGSRSSAKPILGSGTSVYNLAPQTQKAARAGDTSGIAVAGKESSLTVLASGLTVAAILYQFLWK